LDHPYHGLPRFGDRIARSKNSQLDHSGNPGG
jgi:hypothetical protein